MFVEYSRLVRGKPIALRQCLSLKVYRFASLRSIFLHQALRLPKRGRNKMSGKRRLLRKFFNTIEHRSGRLFSQLTLLLSQADVIECFKELRSEEHTSELQSQSNLVCRL